MFLKLSYRISENFKSLLTIKKIFLMVYLHKHLHA